jgi:hypothetical protein
MLAERGRATVTWRVAWLSGNGGGGSFGAMEGNRGSWWMERGRGGLNERGLGPEHKKNGGFWW